MDGNYCFIAHHKHFKWNTISLHKQFSLKISVGPSTPLSLSLELAGEVSSVMGKGRLCRTAVCVLLHLKHL